MQRDVLFGIAHSANHNNTEFVRGLFEVENRFFFFTPEDFRCFHSLRPHLVFPEQGDIIAFLPALDFDQENRGFLIFDQIPGIKQSRVWEIIDVGLKPLSNLPKNLLIKKHQSDELIEAVKNLKIETARKLIDEGADPNSIDPNGSSALLHAIAKEDIEIITFLVSSGADPSRPNANNVSPLSLANDRFTKALPVFDKSGLDITTVNWIKYLRDHPLECEDSERN